MDAGVIQRRLGPRERRTIVAEEKDECVLGVFGLLERIQEEADALIETADGLIIICPFAANLRPVREEIREGHVAWLVGDCLDARIAVFIGESLGPAVWVREPDDKGERFVAAVTEELPCLLGHLGDAAIAGETLDHLYIEAIYRTRLHVDLAEDAGTIAVGPEQARQAGYVRKGMKIVCSMGQAVLAVRMRM